MIALFCVALVSALPAALPAAETASASNGHDALSAGPFFLLGVLALALNALFTIAQTAIAGLGPHAIEEIGHSNAVIDRPARRFIGKLPQLEHQFQIAALFMLLLTSLFFLRGFIALDPGHPGLSAGVGALLAMVLQLMLIEVLARNIALWNPPAVMRHLVPTAWVLSHPVAPIMLPSYLFGAFSRGARPTTSLSDMHLRLLPSLSGIDRVLDEEAFEMIDSVRDFANTTAEQVMTPRTQVLGIADNTAPEEVYARLRESHFSRVVVYHQNLDNVIGTLLAKEVLLQRPEDPFSLLRKPLTVGEETRLPELLRLIRQNRSHLVVVQDEYGGMGGIVTLHDLFEMIVGHMEDTDDKEELWIEKIGESSYRLSGRVEIWEVNEELGLELDESVARTVGGFLFNSLGRVAREGDVIEAAGAALRVIKVIDKRVDVVELSIGGAVHQSARVEDGSDG